MPPLYDDDSLAPLVERERPRKKKKNDGGIIFNRVLTLLTLAALVGLSLYFQSTQKELTHQLQEEEQKVKTLSTTIDAQSQVIKRFNESVTNSDVLHQLKLLEDSLTHQQHALEERLDATLRDVNHRLDETLDNLDATVKSAEQEIQDQVDIVKKDFEQYVIKTEDQFSMENSFMVYQLAGTFTLLSCLISMWHMTAHLRKFNQPVIQRKILAILWMSPIYAITSWFSLVFHSAEGYLAIIKDAYEAYIIYQFLSFCIAVLGKGDRGAVVDLLTKRADHLTPPFRLFVCCKRDPYENDRALADAILLQCQLFAMQFVFFRPATTIATVMLNKYEYYGPWADGPNDYRAPQFYVTLIQNLSIFTAFTGLLKFYHAVDEDLAWCRPFAKFLCIKGVVFMTFWQGLAITVLAETTDVGGGNAEEWATSAQNFLICLEMLLFSIAHFYCFPTEEWEDNYKANYNKKAKFGDSIALGDFVDDLKLILKGNRRKKLKKPSEPTVPEGNEDDGDYGSGPDELDTSQNDDGTSSTSDLTNSTVDMEDPKKLLAYAVAADLADPKDPELLGAQQRLLSSGILHDKPPAGSTWGQSYQHSISGGSKERTATESTGLLSMDNTGTSPLRPSIFTTIATLSEKDDDIDERGDWTDEHEDQARHF